MYILERGEYNQLIMRKIIEWNLAECDLVKRWRVSLPNTKLLTEKKLGALALIYSDQEKLLSNPETWTN